MDDSKIAEIRSLIAVEDPRSAVSVPVGDLYELLNAHDEARRLSLILQEVGLRHRTQMEAVRTAWASLGNVLRDSHLDGAEAYVPDSVHSLVAHSKWIQAIKVLRDMNPGLGLADAKRIVDRLRGAA